MKDSELEAARKVTAYVAAASELHGLALDDDRRAEVERQFQLLTSMARQFVDIPLPLDIEPAATYRP